MPSLIALPHHQCPFCGIGQALLYEAVGDLRELDCPACGRAALSGAVAERLPDPTLRRRIAAALQHRLPKARTHPVEITTRWLRDRGMD